jgi:hypothetical protein
VSGYLEHALYECELAFQAATVSGADAAAKKHAIIMFGVAAITLDAARAETANVPQAIDTELDQAIALAYAIRCCPAHDISEPVWNLHEKYRRKYKIGDLSVDLTGVNNQAFAMEQVAGPQVLRLLANFLRASDVIRVPA